MLGYTLDNNCLMTAWTVLKKLQYLIGKARKGVAGKDTASICSAQLKYQPLSAGFPLAMSNKT